MFIQNRHGTRFELLVRPRGATGVPVPYASPEAFLVTFTTAQRAQMLRGLGCNPTFPGLDLTALRNVPADVQSVAVLARLVRSRQIAFQHPTQAPTRAVISPGGDTAQTQAPPPPPPPPPVREEVVCELMTVEAECSHNARKANRAGLLEVVPDRNHDRIKLRSQIRGGCGNHPRWEVHAPGANEPVKTGVSSSFVAQSWAFKSLWGVFEVVPREYAVNCTCCSGPTKHLTVKVFPADQWKVNVGIDFKKPPTQWTWNVVLSSVAEEDDAGLKLKSGLLSALQDKKQQLDWAMEKVLAPLVGRETKWDFFKTNLAFQGGWAEHTDHRAFYKYEATLKLDPLIKGEFMIPFGPTNAIPPWIKKWTTDYIGDLYLYLKFAGELTLQGKWGRTGPDEHKASAAGEGKITVKVGGNLFLMKKGALNLDVNGGTSISCEAKAVAARKPAIEYDVKWGGLDIELTIEAAWGMVEYKRKWKPIEGCSLLEKMLGRKPEPWYPLGH